MRKIAVISISILSVFILCSLSYQPIIADTPIEKIKETKLPDDCGCNENTFYPFIRCSIIICMIFILGFIAVCFYPFEVEWLNDLWIFLYERAEEIGCMEYVFTY